MRLITLFAFMLTALPVLAAGHPYVNDREGKSFILSKGENRELQQLEARASRADIAAAFEEVLKANPVESAQDACAFEFVESWNKQVVKFPSFRGNSELFLKALRYHGLVDDVFLKINLRALSVVKAVPTNLRDDYEAPANAATSPYKAFDDYSLKRKRGKCLNENFKELLSSYRSQDSTVTAEKVLGWVNEANRQGLLSDKAEAELVAAGRNKIGTWEISLTDYVQKRLFLRTQFPLPRAEEKAEFVTMKAGKSKTSYRQRLFESYTPMQIILMGDLIRKLKTRLDSPRIEILIHDRSDQVIETVSLEPMERFRFAIRLLRKEMIMLGNHSLFNGRQPAYTDLMAAAFETGHITAKELDEVAGLEEIWNPKKTFLDKALVWGRMFGGVLAIVIPQPFGFIPTLALIAIEAVAAETPDDTTDSLF